MFLINKHTKFRSHMASMPIDEILPTKQTMFIGLSSANSCFWVLSQLIFVRIHILA